MEEKTGETKMFELYKLLSNQYAGIRDTLEILDGIIALVTEFAVPTAAILLIIYLIRQLRKK